MASAPKPPRLSSTLPSSRAGDWQEAVQYARKAGLLTPYGCGSPRLTQPALHKHDVEPLVVFAANGFERAHGAEAHCCVQRD